MIRTTLLLLLLAVAATASATTRTIDSGSGSPCSNKCLRPYQASRYCSFRFCKLVRCRLSPYRWGKRCVQKIVKPSPTPTSSSISITTCPAVCKAQKHAKKDCRNALADCKLVNCEYFKNGRYRRGQSCVDDIPPEPLACPETCMDPKWGRKKCLEPKHKIMCKAVRCTRYVNGRARPGMICTKRAPTLACPEKCIDPKWGRKKCLEPKHKIMCKAVRCTRYVNGRERPGMICTMKKPTPSPSESSSSIPTPTATATADPTMTATATAVPTTTVPTMTATATATSTAVPTMTATATAAAVPTMTATATATAAPTPTCPDCIGGEFRISGPPTCICNPDPCAACPAGTVCLTSTGGSKFCAKCNCGFCDEDSNPCCEANGNDTNCKPSNGATTPDCKVSDFFSSGSGDVCAGSEKDDDAGFASNCGCVPSRTELCNIPIGPGVCSVPRRA